MLDFGADINAAIEAETARIYTWLELAFDAGTLRCSNCDIPFYIDGHRVEPGVIKAPNLKQRSDVSVDNYTFRIGNAGQQMSAVLNGADVAGTEARMGLAVTDSDHQLLASAVLRHGLLDAWDEDPKEATLRIADETIRWQQKTLRRIASRCPWPFKQTECAYAGSAATCDRSYARCQELANADNFGGHRFLTALCGKEILWGSRSWKIKEEDGEAVLPLPYGRCRVEAVRTYLGVDASGNMHVIALFGEGPVQGLVSIGGDPQIWVNKEPVTDFGSLISYDFYTGTDTQNVCSALAAALPEWDDPLRYTCYAHLQFAPSQSIPNDPDIEALIDGLIIYNPITETSAFTNNRALVAYDHATRPRHRGGMGIEAARINQSSLSATIDYCTAEGWTFDGPLMDDDPCGDHQQLILDGFRGALLPSGDAFFYKFRDLNYESAVMDLTIEDFKPGSLKASMDDGLDRPDVINVEFINPDKAYTDDVLPVPATALAGVQDAETVDMRGLTAQAAGNMGMYILERRQYNKKVAGTGRNRTWRLQPLDIVTITDDARGWDQVLARVESCDPKMDFTSKLEFSLETSWLYDGVYNLTADVWDNTSLPGPNDPVPNVAVNSISEEQYDFREEVHTRIKIDFEGPANYPWWKHAQVHLRIEADGDWEHVANSTGPYQYGPVQEGVTYYFKLVGVRGGAVEQIEDWDSAMLVSHWVVGKSNVPADLPGMVAVANGDTVRIQADALDEPGLSGYEFRRGDAWDGGLLVDFTMKPRVTLSGVRPGIHKFWGVAKDNAGQYAVNPISTEVEVFLPPNYALADQWTWDFDGVGTHDNTEHAIYDSEDALKCLHTADVLTGTYTTPTRDLGSVQAVRVFGDFRHAFVSSDTTFGGVMPDPTTFDDVDAQNKTFQEIFQPTAAAQIKVTLYYSTDNAVYKSKTDFEILCAEVYARWIYCVIVITDPTLDSNAYLLTLNMKAYTGPQQV